MSSKAEKKPDHLLPKEAVDIELHEQILKEVAAQYLECVSIFNYIHILEYAPELGRLAIRDERGSPYPLPNLEDIQASINRNWPLVAEKWRAGFTKLQLTPIAMPLVRFLNLIREQLLKEDDKGTLILPRTEREARGRIIPQLEREETVVCSMERGRLSDHNFVYFPQEFTSLMHGGIQKIWLVDGSNAGISPGWSVMLTEASLLKSLRDTRQSRSNKHIPSPGIGYEKAPAEILKILKQQYHHGESGFTAEDVLTRFLLQLHTTHRVVETDELPNAEIIALGSYFLDWNSVLCTEWNATYQNLWFGRRNATLAPISGDRLYPTAVRLK